MKVSPENLESLVELLLELLLPLARQPRRANDQRPRRIPPLRQRLPPHPRLNRLPEPYLTRQHKPPLRIRYHLVPHETLVRQYLRPRIRYLPTLVPPPQPS